MGIHYRFAVMRSNSNPIRKGWREQNEENVWLGEVVVHVLGKE